MNKNTLIKAIGTTLVVCYPFAIYYVIIKNYNFALILGILFVAVLAGFFINKQKILLCAGLSVVAVACVFREIEYVKAYPVIMNFAVMLFFAMSLLTKPFVQIIGEKINGKLSDNGIRYARKATYAWVIFMFCLTSASATTVFLSTEIWALFNGLISYILVATMFVAEYIVRRKVLKNDC